MNTEKRNRIVEHYFGLVEVVVDKLLSEERYKTYRKLREELLSVGYETLVKSVPKYDPSKGTKIVSYLSMRIYGLCRIYIRDYTKDSFPICYIDDIDSEISYEELEEYNEDWVEFVDKYEPEDEIGRRIYHEILMGSSTQKEIADEFGISKRAVKERIKRLKNKLRVKITEGEANEN